MKVVDFRDHQKMVEQPQHRAVAGCLVAKMFLALPSRETDVSATIGCLLFRCLPGVVLREIEDLS